MWSPLFWLGMTGAGTGLVGRDVAFVLERLGICVVGGVYLQVLLASGVLGCSTVGADEWLIPRTGRLLVLSFPIPKLAWRAPSRRMALELSSEWAQSTRRWC